MTVNPKLRRLPDSQWNEDGYTDEAHLARFALLQPDVISPSLTFLQGKEDARFPLSFSTEGMGNIKALNSMEYSLPIIGRLNKAVPLTVAASANSGIGFTQFTLVFKDRHFSRQYVLSSPNGIQVRVQEDPKQATGGWAYQCVLLPTTDPTATLPSGEGAVGTLWTSLFAPVAYSGSRGNESRVVAPGSMSNQLTYIRKSYRYEGNVTNRMINIELTVNGRPTRMWWEWEEYQHSLNWQFECENLYWYSQYNKDAKGRINLLDDNGNVIPIGSGVLEQIPNYDTYSFLTANKIKGAVRDALFGTSDAQKKNIELQTGTGGMEEFDTAMKRDALGSGFTQVAGDKFISGSGYNLGWGGYFNQYRHVDGNIITVVHNPLFDMGPRAENSPKHPISGLPLESYRMVFLDRSTYEGEANILMVTQKGREMLRWAVAGATVPPGFKGNDTRASDLDASSVHLMKAGGILIRRATHCLNLECTLS